jgi:energy-coupling factor transport system permease protein
MLAKFEGGRSVLHRLNPMAKLLALAAFSISIFLFESVAAELVCLAAIVIAAKAVGSRSTIALLTSRFAFILVAWLIVMQVLFTPGGHRLLTIPLYFTTVTVTDLGIASGLVIALRFLAIVAASILFVSTTDPAGLAYALMQAGVPYRYGFMLITALRFMPVFELEMSTVASAQKARGLDIDSGGVRSLIKSLNYTFVPLAVSALNKVDSQVISMEGRAFGYGSSRTFVRKVSYTGLDYAVIALSAAIVALLLIDVWYGWVPLPHLNR